jgi:hypothetical protein
MKKIVLVCFALIFAGCAETSHEPQSSSAQQSVADAKSGAPAPSASGATTGPTIEAPPTFHKGYKLTFRSRTSDYDVTYQGEQNGLLVFHHDTREKLPYDYLYTPDLKLAGVNDAQLQTQFDPPVGYVEFPLSVGKKWKVAYKSTSNSTHSMADCEVEIVSYGPIKVPYGTVNAFEIRVHNTDREVKRANPVETYWYSPEIGYYVKHDTNKPIFEDPFELTAVSK